MSLYGGIKFAGSDAPAPSAAAMESGSSQSTTSGPAIASSSSKDVAGSSQVSSADTTSTCRQAAGSSADSFTKANAAGPSGGAKSSAGWSAALKFAPRIKQPKPAAPRPATTTMYAAAPVLNIQRPAATDTSAAETSGGGGGAGPSKDKENELVLGPDGRPLAKAPSMVLKSEDNKGGKRAWRKDQGGESQQRRKKKKKNKQQQVFSIFDPEEQYDPNRPNDLGEWQAYRKRMRAERRARLIEERRRKEAGEDSSSYYTDSEDEAPRRDAPKMFAPPKVYSPPKNTRPLPPDDDDFSPPPPPPSAPPASVPPPATGDEAYARRLAMSNAAATGEDAYARRAAMSSQMQAQTGDDAYARRVAMAAGRPPPGFAPPQVRPPEPAYGEVPRFAPPNGARPPPPPPSFAPPPPPTPAVALGGAPRPPFAPTMPPGVGLALPTSGSNSTGIPGFGAFAPRPPPPAPSAGAAPAFVALGASAAPAQHSAPLAAPPAPPSVARQDFAQALNARMQAAQAIAAKYAHLSPAPAPAPSAPAPAAVTPKPAEPDDPNASFAEKMMKRWGHTEGSGLGKSGDGIVHALTTEHVEKVPKPGETLSKRQLAKQKVAAANMKKRKWVQHATNRGKIVNANEDERIEAEKSKIGEASRVVVLQGLVDGVEDVDEDMADEIGEECSKYGIVERVVLHMVEPAPPEPSDCLRVFVVFSGMAGAWRSIKELDGRFFGGRKIAARYFDEGRFDAGDRDGPI